MQMPNIAVGEFAVHVGDRSWFFRPSLLAISRLGSPAEIVDKYASVMGAFCRRSFSNSVAVLWECEVDCDSSELTGYSHSYGRWVAGLIPPEDVHVLAQCLMKHGVTGNLELTRRKSKAEDYTSEFSAADCVAMAMAHLGMSEREAWQLTMTSFVRAMHAKYPGEAQTAAATKKQVIEADETMSWLSRVNAARSKSDRASSIAN